MDKYLVVGNPISHSKSPFIHTLFARQTGQAMTYEALEVPLDDFEPCMLDFFSKGGRGCNVTLPFKEDAYRFATRLTERARKAGAVNTLKKLDDGGIIGDNTDGEGLVQDLLSLGILIENANILLLGAGGAARGVVLPLLNQHPKSLLIVNRTQSKADTLASIFCEFPEVSSGGFTELSSSFDLVINSTSASLSGERLDIPTSIIGRETVVYDMAYGQGLTCFNQWAIEQGSPRVLDGLGMLVAQAAESFVLWRGIRPGTHQVLRELRQNFAG